MSVLTSRKQKWRVFRLKILTQWSVVIEYQDASRKVFTFQAEQGPKGNASIIPTRCSDYPRRGQVGRLIVLGSVTASPKQLVDFARYVSCNGQPYKLIKTNSRMWCREFCWWLSEDFAGNKCWESTSSALATASSFIENASNLPHAIVELFSMTASRSTMRYQSL